MDTKKKCINFGDFKRRVIIEEPAKVSDGMGGNTVTWSTVFTAWCSIKPLSGRERMTAMKMEAQITHKIMMRYDSRVTTKLRINYSDNGSGTDRIFNIVEVINIDEESRFLEVLAVEGAAT